MITRLTKIQLIIFAIVTVLGGAFVGGRYANIDRLFVDRSYPVTADFKDSGGIFAGAEVTYRGIAVGKVGRLEFTDSGVRATLDIENDAPKISDDVKALVANKSAVGEQFIDLQPQSNSSPYLRSGSNIPLSRTNVPIDTTKILLDASAFVGSIDTESLKTLVNELGLAFAGNGRDLTIIIDTMTSFIQTADDNFDVTRSLIRSSSSCPADARRQARPVLVLHQRPGAAVRHPRPLRQGHPPPLRRRLVERAPGQGRRQGEQQEPPVDLQRPQHRDGVDR